MNDSDELYTVELNQSMYTPAKINSKSVPADTDKVRLPENKENGQFQLFQENTERVKEEKHKEFLRLRDTIFNKNRGPVNNTFIQQARYYVNETAEPTPPVPFSCYWPTYDVMSDVQLKWYFYWREQVRNDEYPVTALSYIFVYIYEIINEVGIEDSDEGFIRLCSVWNAYRRNYPNLDRYMSTWIADYAIIHFPDGLSEYALTKVSYLEIKELLPESILINRLFSKTNAGLNDTSILNYLLKYSSFKLESSKFYQGENKKVLETYLIDVFLYINSHMEKESGKGIFETFIPQKTLKRMPYQNAIYQGKIRSVDIGTGDYANNKPLRMFITDIFKQVENVLRKLNGTKGKLKNNLSPQYNNLIEKYITDKRNEEIIEKRAKIEIDKSKIKQLIDHSEIIRDKLLSGVNPDSADENDNEIEPASIEPLFVNQKPEPVAEQTETPSCGSYPELMALLTGIQKQILIFISDKEGSVPLTEVTSAFGGVFVQMEIDNINEAAIDCYGDILILTEEDNLLLQEL